MDLSELYKDEPPKKKKKVTDQQIKRQKYDILEAFFAVYFIKDPEAAVLKNAVYSLYKQKINEGRIARNALFRFMWSYFGDIKTFRSNYREYIRGLKLMTDTSHLDQSKMNFLELLQQNIVVDVFDFKIEELIPEDETTTSNDVPSIQNSDDFNSDILEYILQLEEQATNLTNSIHN